MNMPMGKPGGNGGDFPSMIKFMLFVCFLLFGAGLGLLVGIFLTLRRVLAVQERILECLSPAESEEERIAGMSMG